MNLFFRRTRNNMLRCKKLLSGVLVALMVAQTAVPIFAYSPEFIRRDDGTIIMTDSDGNAVMVDQSWEETYPTGTLAFNTTQVNLTENGDGDTASGSLTLYRLGGSDGRAVAKVTLVPTVACLDDSTLTYAYAAGRDDYLVEVENPAPYALTDPLGGSPEVLISGTQLLERPMTPAEVQERGLDESVDFAYALVNEPDASDFQWQIRLGEDGKWTDIVGATGSDLPASKELGGLFTEYDVRCKYTVGGVRYCSVSNREEVYVQPDVYEMEGWDELAEYYAGLDESEKFSPVIFEGNEYDSYSFYVVFGEGEDEKEIRFTALDDDAHESGEVVNIVIEEAYGATLYQTANVATVAIADDEPELPSAMGFESTEIWADMSEGVVRIPLYRTVEDSDALIYVTGADYTVVEGTAIPGRNYARTEDGTVLFPAELDFSALEITLVNDGEILAKEDSDLYFTVRLTAAKGGGSSTLIDDADEITVRLYNSGEGGASNIASRMYSADEVDMTIDVSETVSLVPSASTIVAEAEEKPADAVAEYVPAVEGNNSRMIDYGKLSFSNVQGNSAYWSSKLLLANVDNKFDTANTDRFGTIQWNGGQAYGDGWEITCNKGGSIFGTIENMYTLYTTFDLYMKGYADKHMSDYSKLGFRFSSDDTVYSLKYPNTKLSDVGHHENAEAEISHPIKPSDTGIGLVCDYHNTAAIRYKAYSWIELRAASLTRRLINTPTIRIYTADDDQIYANDSIKNQNLFNALKPEIKMTAGQGGVYNADKLYMGSKLTLTRGLNASSYAFSTTANGLLEGAVVLYDTEKNKTLSTASISNNGTASLQLFFDPSYEDHNTDLRIYMDRLQTVTLDISPSVPRVVEDGRVTSSIDSSKIGATWEALKSKNDAKISFGGQELNPTTYKFDPVIGKEALSAFSASAGSAQYKSGKFKNLQTINFGLDKEDIILFNGEAYAGDETITIPVSMLLNDNLTFYYYNKESINLENIMSATIARVERYLDLNDNGIVDGIYDEDNGVFNVDVNGDEKVGEGEDMALESISDIESITISSLAPQMYNGAYHQVILKVYYNMLPRSMNITTGHTEYDRAEIVPAIVTSITDAKAKKALTSEQRGYRYINHSGTGSGKLMFTAAATKTSYVDIPLGGDMSPAKVSGNDVVWNPNWKGNPYAGTEFTNPEPITLNGTALGDGYKVGETIGSGVNIGKLTDDGIKKVAAYLSAMQANDRFALCVRETPKPKARIADEPEHYLEGIESSTLSAFYTYPSTVGVRTMTDPYAEKDEDGKSKKEAGFDMNKSGSSMPEYNMNGEINMPELELGLTDYVTISTNGQELAISVGANLIGFKSESGTNNHLKPESPEMNSAYHEGKEGIDKVKKLYNSLFSHGPGSKEGIGKDVKDEFEKLKKAGESQDKKMPGIKSLGFEGNIAVNISMVLKWNPLENNFFFYQLMVMFAGELQFSFSVKLTPCPIFYVSITVGIGVELATGLERQRVKVRGETVNLTDSDGKTDKAEGGWKYYTDQFHMGNDALDEPENIDFVVGTPSAQLIYETNAKAIDVYFAGSLYVDAKDADGNRPEGFSPGVISSAGDEAVTVKLAKVVNGTNDKEYTVTFTVVDDGKTRQYRANQQNADLPKGHVIFDCITTIQKQTDDVYFAGLQLSPELFMEVAVGVGVELFNIELFINITIGASFGFINHDSPEYIEDGGTTDGAVVNEFSFVAGVGLRVTALFFSFEFNAIQFAITYDRNATYDEDTAAKSGWNFIWYAANQPIASYSARNREAVDPLKVRIVLPESLAGREQLFSAAENAGMSLSRAFNPTDTEVPFQYSGYGSSGDAFTLGKDLLPGTNYELITVGDTNYVVYTLTNLDSSAEGINSTMLVLSKVQETVIYEDQVYDPEFQDSENMEKYVERTSMGLAHPTDPDSTVKYLKLDNDSTGDLDFGVWADGDKLRVAWVSYTAEAAGAYEDALAGGGDYIDAMQAASVHTVVKTAAFDTAAKTLSKAEQVTPAAPSAVPADTEGDNTEGPVTPAVPVRGIYTSPSGAGDMIFYSEAIPYTEEELAELLADYETYYGCDPAFGDMESTAVDGDELYYGTSDPTTAFRMQQKRLQSAVYGKSFYPSYAYKTEDGSYVNAQVKSDSWIKDGVNLENSALTKIGNDYYAAYTTAQYKLQTTTKDNGTVTEEEVIRKLYLQKVTVGTEDQTVETIIPPEDGIGEPTIKTETITVTTVKPGDAIAIRKLLDNRDDNTDDGVYAGGSHAEAYKDPYFANVKFLCGILGELDSEKVDIEYNDGDIVPVTPRARSTETAQEFLLFEMNANTYIVPKADILSITGSEHEGGIIPFFTRRTAAEVTDGMGDIIANNVTIGADGNGSISAVYTATVENTSNTALYLTKYDSQSNTWGAGTMLAMHHMQTHEDSVREGWTVEKTKKEYFKPASYGSSDDVYTFTFGRTAIGLAGEDKLLVLAEGSKLLLEEQTQYKPVYTYDDKGIGTLKEIVKDGTTFVPKTKNDAYAISDGIYALSFSSGKSSLGYASLNLSNYDFTPASEMYASVSFTNTGDVAIRASKKEPVSIQLMTDASSVPLQTWKVTETIRAGQSVSTTGEYVTLPNEIEAGDKIYFTVSEYTENNYITNPFFESTRTADGEADTAACITVENRVELGYESDGFDRPYITMVSADEDTVTLQADIHVGNRGSRDSGKTYLKFEYETMNGDELVISPVNLEGHKLSVSDQAPLSRSENAKTLQNGYLLLATTENGRALSENDTGSIKSMHGRTVTGTFTVPKDYFDTGYGTHSLNLRLTLEGYDEMGELYKEYDVSNNMTFVSVEQKTFYEAANNLNMQVGSYLRIPVSMQTSRETAPSVTVTEITDDGKRNLSMLYYDAVQGAVIIMPADVGEGRIRLADVNTNSIYDICYTVVGEGLAINIYEDNGIFTWLDSSKRDGDTGRDAWEFKTDIMQWSNSNTALPYRHDLAQADAGEAFTFRTLASSIDLYFMGEGNSEAEIIVSSTLSGYNATKYTSADGSTAVRIDFGNDKAEAHTVTVQAVSSVVRFDKMIESFPADFEVKNDPAAPNLYFERTLPKMASMKDVPDDCTLGIYFVDMGGLTSVTLDDTDITDQVTRVNESNELWYYELPVTGNSGHSIVITDQSGNVTTRTLSIDWFSTDPQTSDPGAEEISVVVVDQNDKEITGILDSNTEYFLKVTGQNGEPLKGAAVSYLPFGSDSQDSDTQTFSPAGFSDGDGLFRLTNSAVYRVDYTPSGSTVTSTRMLCIDKGSTSYPEPFLVYNEEKDLLEYSAIVRDTSTTGKLSISSPIVSMDLNGIPLLSEGQKGTYFEGIYPIVAGGDYTLTVVNANGKTADMKITVDPMPIRITGPALTYQMVSETEEDGTYVSANDGKLTIDESKFIGGVRTEDGMRADYEYALVPAGSEPAEDDWQDETEFSGLEVGDYVLYVRDRNDTDNEAVTYTTDVHIGFARVRIDSVDSTPTVPGGNTGSITVSAQGGYTELEYDYVPDGEEGTDYTADETSITYQGVTYPRWSTESTMNFLPEGIYTVTVRERGNPDNSFASEQIHVPHVVTIEEIRTVPVQNNENNGQILVIASGGYNGLEYSYVHENGVIDTKDTDDDRDDTVTVDGVEYPLWTMEPHMNGLPTGEYTVRVRDGRGTVVEQTAVTVPDHIVVRVNTVPTYEDESTGSITVIAIGGYGAFEYCYLPLGDDGKLRDDVVIGTASDPEEPDVQYQTITFDGREPAPLWTSEYELRDIPKGDYLVIARDTADPNNLREYPDAEDLVDAADNQYTAVMKANIRNHDKFEISVVTDIYTTADPEGITLVQRHRGLTVTFDAVPGADIVYVVIDGKTYYGLRSYTFTDVNEPHTVEVVGKDLETIPRRIFELNVSSTEGGSVSSEGRLLAAYGSTRTLRFVPEEGWRVADVIVDGESIGAAASYEFRAIIEAHTLHVVFEKIDGGR